MARNTACHSSVLRGAACGWYARLRIVRRGCRDRGEKRASCRNKRRLSRPQRVGSQGRGNGKGKGKEKGNERERKGKEKNINWECLEFFGNA